MLIVIFLFILRKYNSIFIVIFVVDNISPFDPSSVALYPSQDRAALQLDEGTSQFAASNRTNLENFSSGSSPRLPENERLPGAVLLARARLLERLRGVPVPVSGSRLVCSNLKCGIQNSIISANA